MEELKATRPLALVTGASSGIGYNLANAEPNAATTWSLPPTTCSTGGAAISRRWAPRSRRCRLTSPPLEGVDKFYGARMAARSMRCCERRPRPGAAPFSTRISRRSST